MKKILINGVVAAFALTGCFEGGDIASVKGGVMDFNKSLKVGDAFGNWGECTQKRWSEFKTSNGKRIVQFECQSTKVQDFMRTVRSNFPNSRFQDASKDLDSTIMTVQWTINADDSFELSSFEKRYKWADGSVQEWTPKLDKLLQNVYNNVVEFDVARLETPRGSNAADYILTSLGMVRGYGKMVSPPTVSSAPPAEQKMVSPVVGAGASGATENYAESWQTIQKDPNAYLAKCTGEQKLVYMNNAGSVAAIAEAEARSDCTTKIAEVKQCMTKPGMKIDTCFDSANNRGD